MAIPDLPVWTIPPNWSRAVIERLEWLSFVHISDSGAEQRGSRRLTPRRSFEFTVNPTHGARTFMDLWLHRLGSKDCLAPLWHDKAKLVADADSGDTRLDFDNTFREFTVGGFAIVYGSTFKYEVVEITAMDDNGVTLATGLTNDWKKFAVVYPLRQFYIDYETNFAAIISRVGEASMLFTVNGENPYDEGEEDGLIYEGYPVLTVEPNRYDNLDQVFERMAYTQDGGFGKVYQRDDVGRAFVRSMYNWQVRGREAHHKFRQFLYRQRGRARALWLPTFNEDFSLTQDAAPGAGSLVVGKTGLDYVGGPASGREHILIRHAEGFQANRIGALGVAPSPDVDRLMLYYAIPKAVPAGRMVSFLDVARFEQDAFEITHHTDTNGVSEASAALRSFRDERDPSGPNFVPNPAADMTDGTCGPLDLGPCVPEKSCIGPWSLEYEVDKGTNGYFSGTNGPWPAMSIGPIDGTIDGSLIGGWIPWISVPVVDIDGVERQWNGGRLDDIEQGPHGGGPGIAPIHEVILQSTGRGPYQVGDPNFQKFAKAKMCMNFARPSFDMRMAADIQFPAGSGATNQHANIRFFLRDNVAGTRTQLLFEGGDSAKPVVSLWPTTYLFIIPGVGP